LAGAKGSTMKVKGGAKEVQSPGPRTLSTVECAQTIQEGNKRKKDESWSKKPFGRVPWVSKYRVVGQREFISGQRGLRGAAMCKSSSLAGGGGQEGKTSLRKLHKKIEKNNGRWYKLKHQPGVEMFETGKGYILRREKEKSNEVK